MKKENCEYLTYLIIDKLELNLEVWGDWEASLSQFESGGDWEASLSQSICGEDQGASLPQSE